MVETNDPLDKSSEASPVEAVSSEATDSAVEEVGAPSEDGTAMQDIAIAGYPGRSEESAATASAVREEAEAATSEEGADDAAGDQAEAAASEEGADDAPAAEPALPAVDWQAEHDKVKARLLRAMADFDNYRKRVRRDLQDAAHRARDEVLQELLPVVDNLERAVEHAGASGEQVDHKSLLEGVQLVLRQFQSAMERFDVRGFSALGQPFDPSLHEAMQQRQTDDVAPGTVVEEYRKGYMMGDRLVRPAMVVVAAAPARAESGQGGTSAPGDVVEVDEGGEPTADRAPEQDAEGGDAGDHSGASRG